METFDKVQIVGMVWYKPEDYDACLGIMADRHKLFANFHQWRMSAETGEKKLRRQGKTVIRVFIDPETFYGWCQDRKLDINADARNQYAGWVAYQIATGSQESGESH